MAACNTHRIRTAQQAQEFVELSMEERSILDIVLFDLGRFRTLMLVLG